MTDRSNIRDVAKLAGVAVKTVSRVLNNHPYVSATTKAKVDAPIGSPPVFWREGSGYASLFASLLDVRDSI